MTNSNFPSGNLGGAFGKSNPTVGRYLPCIITAASGALVTLVSIFLPFVSVSNAYVSVSASIADSSDGLLIALSWLAVILAAGTCVALFFNDKVKVPDTTFGAVLIASGACVLSNWVANINPANEVRSVGTTYGVEVGRGMGYWLYLLGAILLLAAGGLLIYLANKASANATQRAYYNPGQPYGQAPQQPGQGQQPGQPYDYSHQGQHLQQGQQPPYPNQPYQQPGQPSQPGQPGQQYWQPGGHTYQQPPHPYQQGEPPQFPRQ